jgi:predicted deacylase
MPYPRLALPLLIPALFAAGLDAASSDPKVVEIGTARGVPGQTVRGSLVVAEAADGSHVALPIAIVTGRQAGPVVWVEASAHGDEYGGPRALQDVVRSLDPAVMTGTVVAVMITNPLAFRALQRVNPNLDDLEDIGGAFPGRDRFATERVAAAVSANVRRVAEYFVDMHTGGDRFIQQPFVFYSVTGTVPADRYDELARSFGVPTLWRDTEKIFASDATTIFSAAGIPSFLLEVGGGQPLETADLRLQAEAVRSFLRKVGALQGGPPHPTAQTIVTGYQIDEWAGRILRATVSRRPRAREAFGEDLRRARRHGQRVTAPPGTDIVLGVSTYPAAATEAGCSARHRAAGGCGGAEVGSAIAPLRAAISVAPLRSAPSIHVAPMSDSQDQVAVRRPGVDHAIVAHAPAQKALELTGQRLTGGALLDERLLDLPQDAEAQRGRVVRDRMRLRPCTQRAAANRFLISDDEMIGSSLVPEPISATW